ncbi:MAG: hypothetical protein HYV09_40605 [Deltaproteobacteria bacterium]|nr:hypothetical protein [Deltaproteobacteria bacterium]
MLPFAVGSPLPADDEYDLDRATFGGVSKTPVGPGELGAFYGRSGDVVVFETSGPCSTGRAIRCYDGTGRVQTTDEPWRVENNGFHVPGYVLHDAGAGEYVEVLLA